MLSLLGPSTLRLHLGLEAAAVEDRLEDSCSDVPLPRVGGVQIGQILSDGTHLRRQRERRESQRLRHADFRRLGDEALLRSDDVGPSLQ